MKQILFKATMEGCGVVNYDDNSQSYLLNKFGLTENVPKKDGKTTENVKYAKKHYFARRDEDGNPKKDEKGNQMYDYKIKISSDCLRNGIFKDDAEFTNPIIIKDDFIAHNYMLSIEGIERGYCFTNKDESGYKRKSCLTITDAVETSNAKSAIEIGTCSGERNVTSMYYTEKVGKTTYETSGVIDFKTLMFVVADPMFDRLAINPDYLTNGVVEKIMHNLYGDIAKPTIGYFTASSKSLTQKISEYGMILNEELVVFLVKELLKRIMGCSIKRSNAYANVTSLSIKFVDDIIYDKFDDENGWIELNSLEDVDNLEFTVDCPYERMDDEHKDALEALKEEYNKAVEEAKEAKKQKKEEKAKAKASKKNKDAESIVTEG